MMVWSSWGSWYHDKI